MTITYLADAPLRRDIYLVLSALIREEITIRDFAPHVINVFKALGWKPSTHEFPLGDITNFTWD